MRLYAEGRWKSVSNSMAEEAVCGDTHKQSERRAVAASCWKAALLNHPQLLHQVNISASAQDQNAQQDSRRSFSHLCFLSATIPV